jgi:hypothetical protein
MGSYRAIEELPFNKHPLLLLVFHIVRSNDTQEHRERERVNKATGTEEFLIYLTNHWLQVAGSLTPD